MKTKLNTTITEYLTLTKQDCVTQDQWFIGNVCELTTTGTVCNSDFKCSSNYNKNFTVSLAFYVHKKSVRIAAWYGSPYLDGRGSIYDTKYGLGNVLYKWTGNTISITSAVVGLSDTIQWVCTQTNPVEWLGLCIRLLY